MRATRQNISDAELANIAADSVDLEAESDSLNAPPNTIVVTPDDPKQAEKRSRKTTGHDRRDLSDADTDSAQSNQHAQAMPLPQTQGASPQNSQGLLLQQMQSPSPPLPQGPFQQHGQGLNPQQMQGPSAPPPHGMFSQQMQGPSVAATSVSAANISPAWTTVLATSLWISPSIYAAAAIGAESKLVCFRSDPS